MLLKLIELLFSFEQKHHFSQISLNDFVSISAHAGIIIL